MLGTEERPARESVDDAAIRTHLANERTFLAWLRTAIVLIAAGIAAAALTETDGFERAVAVTLGTVAGTYRPANRLPMVAAILTAVVGVGAIVFAGVEWYAD